MTSDEKRKVCLIYGEDYLREMNRLTRVEGRAFLVHELMKTYKLLDSVSIKEPQQATEKELKCFHSEDYIDFIKQVNDVGDLEREDLWEKCQQFGLDYDCPLIDNLYTLISWQAGGTITAARLLTSGSYSVVINWEGGWHHAKKDEAAGFCYINDPVIGILYLRQKFEKVLYVDLDLHHSDGVEDAFALTSKVMCVSFHKYEEGFFPGTGSVNDKGYGKGKYYTVNVPLKDGITDKKYCDIVTSVLKKVFETFRPNAIVCQCGVDTLSTDPMESFNLTNYGIEFCVKFLLSQKIPILFLGGGGYNFANAARCWSYLTAILVGQELDTDVPDHKYFLEYGPDYDLHITPGNRPDKNNEEYIDEIMKTVFNNLEHVS